MREHTLEVRSDERGWVIDPLVECPEGLELGSVHLGSLEPGAVRGNHVHPDGTEYILIWGGRAEVAWEEADRVVRAEVEGEELTVFEIPAGVAHAVTNIGSATVYLMAYYFGSGEREWPETRRKPIV